MAKRNRCKKTKEEGQAFLKDFLDRYSEDERVLKMKDFPHHPPISAYTHTMRVVCKCVEVVNKLNWSVEWDDLLMAALLHDFYLYDFTKLFNPYHGVHHPIAAMRNAIEQFGINKHVQRIIRCHMFPMSFWRIPTSREAWVLSIADKMIAAKEMRTKK